MASTSRSAAPCRCGGRAASRGGADGSPRGLDVDCAGDARVEWGARCARRCHSPPEAKRCGTPQHRLLAAKLAYDEGVNGPLRDEREVGPWRVVPVGRHPIGEAARMVYAHGPHTSFSARAGGLPGVGALAMGGVAFSDYPAEVQVAAGVSMHVPGAWEALASGVLPGALFPLREGETALPVRVGWQVSGSTSPTTVEDAGARRRRATRPPRPGGTRRTRPAGRGTRHGRNRATVGENLRRLVEGLPDRGLMMRTRRPRTV